MRALDLLDAVLSDPAPTGRTRWFYDNLVPKTFEANLCWREAIWTLSADPLIQQELRIISSRDMLFEINSFGFVSNRRDHRFCADQPFITYPFQNRFLLELQKLIGVEDVAIPKSRQVGISEAFTCGGTSPR